MLSIQFIRENQEIVNKALTKRGWDQDGLKKVSHAIELDVKRRKIQTELDKKKSESNSISKEIGKLFKAGKKEEGNALRGETSALKEVEKILESEKQDVEAALNEVLYDFPNIPHDSVPDGLSENDNEEVSRSFEGEIEQEGLAHWEIAEKHNLINFQDGAKVTGAGFPFYKGKGARLQRGLINFFLDHNTNLGYEETIPPFVVNKDSATATGQLPDKEGQMYEVVNEEIYLIPTSEVPLTNIYRNTILNESDLPIKLTAYSPCFRREAGSYGKDVRGLNRLHQFEKVELVCISKPNDSYETFDNMVNVVERLLIKLELPYRVLRLCAGDLGFTSALTYDFEVFSKAQGRWLEVSSVSNFESFQTNRLKCRYRDNESGNMNLCHTLNGSSLALPRIVAAILENHQLEDGSVKIPRALINYCGFDKIG